MSYFSEGELDQELDYFARHKEEWLRSHEGEFVVVYGLKLLGFVPAWDEAFRHAMRSVPQATAVLVKQVLKEEPVYLIFAHTEEGGKVEP